MTRIFFNLPVAAALVLSLSACGPEEERAAEPVNPELPRTAQAPSNVEHPGYDPNYRDPSIPQDPTNKDKTKKDSAPPPGTGEAPPVK